MNFLPQLLMDSSLLVTLTVIAFLISWICAFQLFRASGLAKQTQIQLSKAQDKLIYLEISLDIQNILTQALTIASRTKNNIDLCNLLLDGCIHKSDVLTAKAVENSLHFEINNTVEAIKALEEKRAFLEAKIRETFEAVNLKSPLTVLEQKLPYAQVLLEESSVEFGSTEQMKQNVLKVNQVLDGVLLKL